MLRIPLLLKIKLQTDVEKTNKENGCINHNNVKDEKEVLVRCA